VIEQRAQQEVTGERGGRREQPDLRQPGRMALIWMSLYQPTSLWGFAETTICADWICRLLRISLNSISAPPGRRSAFPRQLPRRTEAQPRPQRRSAVRLR